LSPAEQKRISQSVKPVTDQLATRYAPEIVELYNDELARINR
jgi:hypothetical protein